MSCIHRNTSQTGYTLIGVILLVVISGALTSWLIKRAQHDVLALRGARIGAQMVALNDVLTDFTLRYTHEIITSILNTDRSGKAIDLPNVGESIAASYIDERTIEVDAAGLKHIADVLGSPSERPATRHGDHKLQFRLSASGVTAAKSCARWARDNCFIDTLLYRVEPLQTGRRTDLIGLNAATRSMGAGAGFSHPVAPHAIRFSSAYIDSAHEMRNPVPDTPGILVMHNFRSSQSRPLLALRGSKMRGPVNMDGRSIHNAAAVKSQAAGTEKMKDAQLTIAGDGVRSTGSMHFRVPSTNRIFFSDHAGTVIATLASDTIDAYSSSIDTGTVEVSALSFVDTVVENSPCAANTLAFGKSRELIFCKDGRWTRLDGDKGETGRPGRDAR